MKSNPQKEQGYHLVLAMKAEETVMIGNDVREDMVAVQLGMKVFLLTDCLINKEQADISQYPNGEFRDLEAFLEALG